DLLPPHPISAADADHAVRADQRGDQRVPHRRPHHRDDTRRTGQRHDLAALLHLSGRLQFLGHDLCGRADDRSARPARACGLPAIRLSRTADSLPMNAVRPDPYAPTGIWRALESSAAGLLAILWVLPLAYAVWAAFHPGEFTT